MLPFLVFGRLRTSLPLAGLLILLTVPGYAEKKAAAADDYGSVVELSPYEVTARSMEFSHWSKLTSPHFVVYTDAGAKEAARVIKHLEMMHQATQFFLKRRALNAPPLIIVLPTGNSDWQKIGSKGAVEWKVATSLVGSSRPMLLAQYDWQADGLSSVWAMLGINESRGMNLEGPLWFARGVAAFFRTVEFDGDTLTIGKQGMDAFWIDQYGWMSWPKFFTLTSRSPEFVKARKAHDQFEGQCGVFVHQLLTSADPAATPRLLAWVAYLNAGNAPTEEAFKAIFERDWKGWEDQLHHMLNGGSYTTGRIRFPAAALQFSVTATRPPPREMRELFVLSQIMNQRTKDSDASLDALLARGLKTSDFREVLADACDARKRQDARLDELRTAIAAGSSNPGAYADAAGVLFNRAVKEYTIDARIGADVGEIRTWCAAARKLEPLHLDANELQAWTEAFAPEVDARGAETIANICRALDKNARTDRALAALAVARWRLGNAKSARSLCERLNSSALSSAFSKRIANELLARLDAQPAAPAAGAAAPASAAPVDASGSSAKPAEGAARSGG